MRALSTLYIQRMAIAVLLLLTLSLQLEAQLADTRKVITCTVLSPTLQPGQEQFELQVLLSANEGWYIYAPTGVNSSQGMIETKASILLPEGFAKVGRIKIPEPTFKDGYEILEGDAILMTQKIKVLPMTKPGVYELKASITWQACNGQTCLQPMTDQITTEFHYKTK